VNLDVQLALNADEATWSLAGRKYLQMGWKSHFEVKMPGTNVRKALQVFKGGIRTV
jgi:hypothetical protein